MASSSLRPQSNYDVNLNFRGVDTRNKITSRIYDALCRAIIKTFIDDQEIGRGEEIWPNHLREALTDASRLPGFRFTITSR